mgnify:CR=1 FL=1
MNQLSPWPPNAPFPESTLDSTGTGNPDFPGSSGSREQGKFRPSATPRLTQVAVVGDDGKPIAMGLEEVMSEVLLYQKAILLGLSIMTETDLLAEVTG